MLKRKEEEKSLEFMHSELKDSQDYKERPCYKTKQFPLNTHTQSIFTAFFKKEQQKMNSKTHIFHVTRVRFHLFFV